MAQLDHILNKPVVWRGATTDGDTKIFLNGLQANILKGHGRNNTANIFLELPGDSQRARKVVAALAPFVTDARRQLIDADRKRGDRSYDGGGIGCLFLSGEGYRRLGLAAPGGDPVFAGGMAARRDRLNDPDRAHWGEGPWNRANGHPNLLLLLGDDDANRLQQRLGEAIDATEGSGARLVGIDRGKAIFDENGVGLEHFGYADGVSQPIFLDEGGIAAHAAGAWNEVFDPSQFIVADPAGGDLAAGAFFVYRKLEQNVALFKHLEDDRFVGAFHPPIDNKDRPGAMLVGRFEDGTPLALHCDAAVQVPPTNDFDYSGASGARCPVRSHIRKVNPRTAGTRGAIMARRGIPYDERNGGRPEPATEHVGLLFMAYMADIGAQFEVTQADWANSPSFPAVDSGLDPVIGQRRHGTAPTPAEGKWQDACSGAKAQFDMTNCVTLKGGEYFFAPSLPFLRGL